MGPRSRCRGRGRSTATTAGCHSAIGTSRPGRPALRVCATGRRRRARARQVAMSRGPCPFLPSPAGRPTRLPSQVAVFLSPGILGRRSPPSRAAQAWPGTALTGHFAGRRPVPPGSPIPATTSARTTRGPGARSRIRTPEGSQVLPVPGMRRPGTTAVYSPSPLPRLTRPPGLLAAVEGLGSRPR